MMQHRRRPTNCTPGSHVISANQCHPTKRNSKKHTHARILPRENPTHAALRLHSLRLAPGRSTAVLSAFHDRLPCVATTASPPSSSGGHWAVLCPVVLPFLGRKCLERPKEAKLIREKPHNWGRGERSVISLRNATGGCWGNSSAPEAQNSEPGKARPPLKTRAEVTVLSHGSLPQFSLVRRFSGGLRTLTDDCPRTEREDSQGLAGPAAATGHSQ